MEITPSLPLCEKPTRKIEPHAPRAASAGVPPEFASVSPVGQKNNVRNFEPGWNWAFSGRLKGVAPAALASALALKVGQLGAHRVESCTLTHFAVQLEPSVCTFNCATENTSAAICAGVVPPKTTGWPSMVTCRAWSTPPLLRSLMSFGTKRYTNELGWRAVLGLFGLLGSMLVLAPPTSSTMMIFLLSSGWMLSYPPLPKMPPRVRTCDGKLGVI